MGVNKMRVQQKIKYPKSVFFIITNEFCERFSFYGMRTILALYLSNMLKYSESAATMIYHVFICFVYFFPLVGAIVSDSWLGKYRTIFYVSIIYSIGQLILSASAAPPFGLPARELSMLGLLLIALGTGGIKPCVSAFGGDQFILPQQERYLTMFFSLFYFSINTGSLISTLLTPIIRDTTCFDDECFSLAFLVPAILMIVSIVIFVSGKRLYKIVQPRGNLIVKVSKCICHAISNKMKGKERKCDHWLDHADDTYENKLIEDIKAALRVLKLFIPLPIFWALYDQQGSQWTFQATRMDGQIGSFVLLPDQLQAVNPLLIIIFIPIFETCIYPVFEKIHIINTPLKKLVVGGFLASVAFIAAGLVEMEIEKTYPKLPSEGLTQIRIFNTMNCPVSLTWTKQNKKVEIPSLSMWADLEVEAHGSVSLPYVANFIACNDKGYTNFTTSEETGTITATEATASSWVLTPLGLQYNYTDVVDKPDQGKPAIRSLFYLAPELSDSSLKFVDSSGKTVLSIAVNSSVFAHSELKQFEKPNTYDIFLNDYLLKKDVSFRLGGAYTIVGSYLPELKEEITGEIITVTQPNSLHMAYMLPQYIIITMAEVMFSITGLQFAFTQAPESMKSLLTAGWLLSVAFGNLIVVIIKGSRPFERQVYEIFLYAGLMAVVIAIFAVMTMFYKYVEMPEEEEEDDKTIPLEEQNGKVNPTFKEDEK
ncbi:peptide transporter family 1-like isoform X2 [Nylanderia fulva]|uniref:peptide transporter family 1-like isoform X2 n=1 Tax=Nylanderia fulva TaxID=613905 RepID=UPI0010FB408D|nr:peptide transporter family 1-like isoform X2 [Nylanderia fulva]